MRARLAIVALVSSLWACGGDSNSPNDVFPDAAGVYNVTGLIDGLTSAEAHFEGTLTLTQASQASGALGGSAAYTATVGTDVFNLNDDDLTGANISTTGAITYTMTSSTGSTWTFTGTLSGNTITNGRHTLSTSSGSISGAWSATKATSSAVQPAVRARTAILDELGRRVSRE